MKNADRFLSEEDHSPFVTKSRRAEQGWTISGTAPHRHGQRRRSVYAASVSEPVTRGEVEGTYTRDTKTRAPLTGTGKNTTKALSSKDYLKSGETLHQRGAAPPSKMARGIIHALYPAAVMAPLFLTVSRKLRPARQPLTILITFHIVFGKKAVA